MSWIKKGEGFNQGKAKVAKKVLRERIVGEALDTKFLVIMPKY